MIQTYEKWAWCFIAVAFTIMVYDAYNGGLI